MSLSLPIQIPSALLHATARLRCLPLLLIAFPSHLRATAAAGPALLSSSLFDAARTVARSPSWASPPPLELAAARQPTPLA